MRPPIPVRLSTSLLVLGWFAALPGCGSGPATPTVDRETFIDVYVELRVAALGHDDATVTPGERERILAAHGVTAEGLLNFAEIRGRDPAFMRDIWNEIEERLNVDTLSPDTAAAGALPDSLAGT